MLAGHSKISFCFWQDVSPHTLLTWQHCHLLRRENMMVTMGWEQELCGQQLGPTDPADLTSG